MQSEDNDRVEFDYCSCVADANDGTGMLTFQFSFSNSEILKNRYIDGYHRCILFYPYPSISIMDH